MTKLLLSDMDACPFMLLQCKDREWNDGLIVDILDNFVAIDAVSVVTTEDRTQFYSKNCPRAVITTDYSTINNIYNEHCAKVIEVNLSRRFANDKSTRQRETFLILDGIDSRTFFDSSVGKELVANNQQYGLIVLLVAEELLTNINCYTRQNIDKLFIGPGFTSSENQYIFDKWHITCMIADLNSINSSGGWLVKDCESLKVYSRPQPVEESPETVEESPEHVEESPEHVEESQPEQQSMCTIS